MQLCQERATLPRSQEHARAFNSAMSVELCQENATLKQVFATLISVTVRTLITNSVSGSPHEDSMPNALKNQKVLKVLPSGT